MFSQFSKWCLYKFIKIFPIYRPLLEPVTSRLQSELMGKTLFWRRLCPLILLTVFLFLSAFASHRFPSLSHSAFVKIVTLVIGDARKVIRTREKRQKPIWINWTNPGVMPSLFHVSWCSCYCDNTIQVVNMNIWIRILIIVSVDIVSTSVNLHEATHNY